MTYWEDRCIAFLGVLGSTLQHNETRRLYNKLFYPSPSKAEVEWFTGFFSFDFVDVITSKRYFLKILQVVYIVVYVACTFYITTKVLYFVICCLLWPIFPFLIFCGNFIDVKFSSEFFVFEKQFGGFMTKPLPSWRLI